MTSTTARKGGIRPWAVAVWLVVWQLGSMALGQSLLLPSPVSALLTLFSLAGESAFWRAIGWSALRICGGFLLACLAGTLLAALAGRWQLVRELLAPLMAAVKATPVASFIILALVWLNSRSLPLFIAFLMVLPPVYLNVLAGVDHADRQLLEMAGVFRMSRWRTLRYIWLPQVLPYFRSAASLGLGLCWKAGIAAEVIGLPRGSMGERLYTAKVYFQTPELFAWTAVIVAVSVVFEKLFLTAVDALAGKVGG